MMKWLEGKKTKIVALLIPVVSYIKVKGWLGPEEMALAIGILGAAGLYSLRDGMKTEAKKAGV